MFGIEQVIKKKIKYFENNFMSIEYYNVNDL